MKRIATFGMSAIMALAIVAVCASANAANAQSATGLISSVLSRMERNRQSLKSLRANISMDKFDAGLGVWDGKQYGTMMYIPASGRSANARVDWTSPIRETLSIIGGEYLLCREKTKTCWKGKKSPSGSSGISNSVLALMNMSGSQARNSYEVSLINQENVNGVSASHLKITPKGSSDMKFAEIWVDNDGMVVQAKVTSRNSDAQFLQLTNIQKNSGISLDQLKLTPPSDAKIIKS